MPAKIRESLRKSGRVDKYAALCFTSYLQLLVYSAGAQIPTSSTAPFVFLVPPLITDFGPMEYTVIRGDPVALRCQADGTPPPTVKWQKNSKSHTFIDLFTLSL